jgi:prepilin-type N-terminal cleavage/methylation domain-containing protein
VQPRIRTRPAPGFTLLELIVVISIIGIFAVLLTERLQRYAEFAEKTSMEYTANIINSALLFEFASRVIRGKRSDIPELSEVNPVKWLGQQPSNYLGEFRDPPLNEDQLGNWYYDAASHELVYLVRRGDNFQPDSAGKKRVRYRVKFLYDEIEAGSGKMMVGAVMAPVEAYKWF